MARRWVSPRQRFRAFHVKVIVAARFGLKLRTSAAHFAGTVADYSLLMPGWRSFACRLSTIAPLFRNARFPGIILNGRAKPESTHMAAPESFRQRGWLSSVWGR